LSKRPLLFTNRHSGRAGRTGARLPAPVQTGPGAHPAFCRIDTGSFLGVKRPGD